MNEKGTLSPFHKLKRKKISKSFKNKHLPRTFPKAGLLPSGTTQKATLLSAASSNEAPLQIPVLLSVDFCDPKIVFKWKQLQDWGSVRTSIPSPSFLLAFIFALGDASTCNALSFETIHFSFTLKLYFPFLPLMFCLHVPYCLQSQLKRPWKTRLNPIFAST